MRPRAIFVLVLLSGCSVGPNFSPPEAPIPDNWECAYEFSCESPDDFVWWEAFNDPVLNDLICRAASNNTDLTIATYRILEARTLAYGAGFSFYPRLDGSVNYGRVGYNQKMLDNLIGCCEGKGSKHKQANLFEAGFDAEWEIDLFGKSRYEQKAAEAKAFEAQEDFHALWLSLAAEVARNYIELKSLLITEGILHADVLAQKETVDLSSDLIQAGFHSPLDKWRQEETLYTLLAQEYDVKVEIKKTVHRISTLLGENVDDLLCASGPLPTIPSCLPLGSPCDLLRRRPDIQKAEWELIESEAMVGSSVASLFPRLSLLGFIGDLTTFSQGGGLAYYAGPSLLLPIFNSKMLTQDVKANTYRRCQALYNYQKTVLEAVEEVENLICQFQEEGRKNRVLKESLGKAAASYHDLQNLYLAGFVDFKETLEGKRLLLQQEQSVLLSDKNLLISYIALYKALGGEWQSD